MARSPAVRTSRTAGPQSRTTGPLANLIYHTEMHSSRELRSSSFEIEVGGRPARLEQLFEGFGEQDRLGVVMSRPCGAVGASALITATITAFYDLHRARGEDFFVYPDYYLFHVGRPLGDHARLDVWPRRKEVVVGEEPQAILEAIDDRAITRLVVEDRAAAAPDREAVVSDGESAERGEPRLDPEGIASARGRIVTCLAYSPSGRVSGADVRIASNPVTEGYVEAILDAETRIARLRAEAERDGAAEADAAGPGAASATLAGAGALRARIAAIEARIGEVEPDVRMRILRARAGLVEDGVPVETYRRIGLDEALALLAARAPLPAG
jgi:hypothetical protein